ncbi:MAG TPA: Ni/Fe hydrogenase subunit alpha [Terriglobales bacterium]|nr:Ni/Fe hydrogenase subunit alpha [Terriglobales bacterium]
MSERRTRTIRVPALARVEGEGGLEVRVSQGKVTAVRFRVFEPPRLFEGFLRGRDFREAPDITSRICGICPIAYQMSAVHAMEAACGARVDGPLRELRRLLYSGEWIESHALHVVLLHAPDFLGYESAIAMAKDHGTAVERGLALKKIGNAVVDLLGGREIHPVNVRVGGFYRVPTTRELSGLREPLERARDLALELAAWVSRFPFPDFEREVEFVALRPPGEYPFNEGRIASSLGLDIAAAEFDAHFGEEHVRHSTALHGFRRRPASAGPAARGEPEAVYLVGPLARYALNFDRLSPLARETARAAGLGPVCRNPFQSIIVRAVEILWATEEALRIVNAYEPPDRPAVEVEPRAATGWGATEAPRGLLVHGYRLEADGSIAEARIIPPTSQNQRSIERDLRAFVEPRLDADESALTWRCEQTVRNYDPCISCSTHFVKLRIDPDGSACRS